MTSNAARGLALGLSCLVLIVITSCRMPPSPIITLASRGDPIALERFLEGERQRGNRCCAHAVTIVPSADDPTAPAPREGGEALRFELRYDDPDAAFSSKRAEITFDGLDGDGPDRVDTSDLGEIGGSSEWYSFSVFLPESHRLDPAAEIIAQWHAKPDPGEVFRGPVLSLHSRNGDWQIINRHSAKKIQTSNDAPEQRLWQAPYQTGVWTDFTFHTRWDWRPGGQGFVRGWMKLATSDQWSEILSHQGPTAYFDDDNIYFKAGIYKWPWEGCSAGDDVAECSGSGSPVPSSVERRVIYLDAIRVGLGDDADLNPFIGVFSGEKEP